MSPLVSIAVATYNGEDFLSQQMDSLLAQDYPNLEIVISDDCSTDGTWSILQSYADRDARIRLLPQATNLGYVRNFIRVFLACKGDLISPSDQDDIWYPHKTRCLVEAIGDAKLIYCNSRLVNQNNAPLGYNLSDATTMLSGSDPRNFLFATSVSGHAMLFRRELLKSTNKLDTASYIDWMIAFLAARDGHISYLDKVLVDWRRHENATSFHGKNITQASRRKILETDEKTLEAFSNIPGPHQKMAIEGRKKFRRWKNSYFDLSMFFFVIRHGHITHIAHPSRMPALKYLAGHKLKKLLRPDYY